MNYSRNSFELSKCIKTKQTNKKPFSSGSLSSIITTWKARYKFDGQNERVQFQPSLHWQYWRQTKENSSALKSIFSLGQNREWGSFMIKWGSSKLKPFIFIDQEKRVLRGAWMCESRISVYELLLMSNSRTIGVKNSQN